MGSEYMGPVHGPERRQQFPNERFGTPRPTDPSPFEEEDTRPLGGVEPEQIAALTGEEEPTYHEHVSGMLYVPRSEAPRFAPAYRPDPAFPTPGYGPPAYGAGQPYPYPSPHMPYYPGHPVPQNQQGAAQKVQVPYNGYYGYYPYPYGYYGYPPYPPQQPARRSPYQLTIAIISFIGSILAILGGCGCILLLVVLLAIPRTRGFSGQQEFAAIAQFTAFALAGVVGGAFSVYHSTRVLFFKKESGAFRAPWFWVFLVLYLVVIGAGTWLTMKGQAVSNIPLTLFLIVLAGIFPALTFVALGVRRIHCPRQAPWPTTWRRFTLAIASGATLAIGLALVFELILTLIAVRQLGITNISLDNPDQPIPSDPKALLFMFILVSLIAPLVEETVKPLAIITLIGRIRSAAEAFVLGFSAGIGFALVETVGYIGMGYKDWLNVALQRSTAGLLHGFGAGMVALGWYFITHPRSTGRKNRVLLALGCWCYAILQHALWNGSFGLQLLPAPIGPYLDKGTIQLGVITLPSFILVYVVASLLMLIFFLYVTKRLRAASSPPTTTTSNKDEPTHPLPQPRVPARV